MLLTISFIIILIIGVACSIIYHYTYISTTLLDSLGLLFIAVGIVGTFTCGIFILENITGGAKDRYEEIYEEKILLEAVDINELNIDQQYIYYNKVKRTNTIIEKEKKMVRNLWINCFGNKFIANMEYIEIRGAKIPIANTDLKTME